MSYAIFSGDEKDAIAAWDAKERYEASALLLGGAKRTIYVSGGSDTRRDAFEHQRDLWNPLGVNVEYFGWGIVIGGRLALAEEKR